jgi:hypothetical protein
LIRPADPGTHSSGAPGRRERGSPDLQRSADGLAAAAAARWWDANDPVEPAVEDGQGEVPSTHQAAPIPPTGCSCSMSRQPRSAPWKSCRSLLRPDLVAARQVAGGLGQTAIVLTHYESAIAAGLPASTGPGIALLTSHPPTTPAPRPTGAFHHHLTSSAGADDISEVVRRLLDENR